MAELSDGAAICTYKLGQLLCERKTIPNQILLIRKGEARLLGRDQGQLRTFEKLGSGCFVGLASFLRAAPCEEVSAASELEVISISAALILKLLSQEENAKLTLPHSTCQQSSVRQPTVFFRTSILQRMHQR